jgi:hypothetical protein
MDNHHTQPANLRGQETLLARSQEALRALVSAKAVRLLLPPFFFAVLTLAITWPAARTFTTHYIGDPSDDPRHNIWFIWHLLEAFFGRQPLYDVNLLYYPHGISLLTHGYGPVMGFLALPFLPWGIVAAHNGAVLLGFGLTGYALYLLARGLGFNQLVSLFAGTLLLAAPMHVIGPEGHMGKSFFGLMPLALLAVHYALQPARSSRWAIVVAAVLLLNLLHNGLHFIESALAVAFFVTVALLTAAPAARRFFLGRALVIGASTLVLTGPLLFAIRRAASRPGLQVSATWESFEYQPDLVEFFLPPPFTRLLGGLTARLFTAFDVPGIIETAVFLSWVGLLFSLLALVSGRRQARVWLLFTAIWVVLAAGPVLSILGQRTFTSYGLPIILPYAFFTSLPGVDFLRTPGRLMFMGFTGFAIAAAFGLAWLHARYPRAAVPLTAAAIVLVLLETWPQTLSQTPMPEAAPFYRELAGDPTMYGVFDLPANPREDKWYVGYSSRYQIDQMTHGKGIAGGYISRSYAVHPLFPCLIPELRQPTADLLLDGEPATCFSNALHDLAYHNYRYVVWHKPGPDDEYGADPSAVEETSAYLLSLFAGQEAVADDDWLLVYAVPSLAEIAGELTYGFQYNWHESEEGGVRRWARSPATLFISAPEAQEAILEITPESIYDPDYAPPVRGDLRVELDGDLVAILPIEVGQTARLPLEIGAGFHTVSLSLEAGNFRPSDRGSTDRRWLSFAISAINLVTQPEP